ncbi:MAG: hypothetical protein R6V67_03530 [Spirochaetia bacterium]
MKRNRDNLLTQIYTGYAEALKGFVRLLLFLIFIGIITFAVSLPLWYWALHSTATFTGSMLILFSIGIGYFVYSKSSDFFSQKRKEGYSYLSIVKIPLKKTTKIVILLLFVYFIATLVASSRFILAILLTAVAVIIIGFLFFTS